MLEEAYNQEPGVIQHISAFTRSARTSQWGFSFTEEWPVLGETHQASITFTAAGPGAGEGGMGDLALNYRLQLLGTGDDRLAIAPRLTALLPTGDETRGLGSGGVGGQLNVPVSVLLSPRFVTHINVGGTHVPAARDTTGQRVTLTSFAAGSGIVWLAHQNFNVLCEALYTRTWLSLPSGSSQNALTINPGVRGAINFANGLQIVPGLSAPIGVGPSRGERAGFLYLSFEHPFRLAGSPEPDERRSEPGVR